MEPKHRERLNWVQRWMREKDLDVFVITSPASIYYLIGVTPSSAPGLVVFSDSRNEPVLVVRGSEFRDIEIRSPIPVEGAPYGTSGVDVLASVVLTSVGRRARIGFDEDAMSAAKLLALQAELPEATLTPAGALIMDMRLVKDVEEIAMLRRAAQVSDQAMLAAVQGIKAGKTEAEAAAIAESTWRAFGLGPAYEPLIGSGARTAALRRFPSLIVPEPDELIRFDFAARVSDAVGYGYHNDMTRTFTRGKASPEHLSMLEAGLAVFEATLASLRAGRTIGEVAEEGLRQVRGTKYEQWTYMAGHGIGADIHEPPTFRRGSDFVMRVGNCFAIEPTVLIPGERAVCFESVVIITEGGWEALNQLDLRLWGT